MRLIRPILCLLAGLSAAPALAQTTTADVPAVPSGWQATISADHPLAGRIWSVAEKQFVTPASLAADLAAASYVALGETHDNPDHHRLQAWVLRALVTLGRRPAVVFEMIPADLAPQLEAHLAERPDDAAGLGEALQWQARGWPEWALYQPIAAAALQSGLKLAAGDLPRDMLKRVRGEGEAALGEGRAATLGLDRPLGATAEQRLKQELRDGHCGLLPDAAIEAMYPMQRVRDAALADAMIEADGGDGAVLIAGAGHVRADFGAPWYLLRRAPTEARSVAFVEVQAGETEAEAYLPGEAAFDYLWFTPAAAREDPCAKLQEQFGKQQRPAQ